MILAILVTLAIYEDEHPNFEPILASLQHLKKKKLEQIWHTGRRSELDLLPGLKELIRAKIKIVREFGKVRKDPLLPSPDDLLGYNSRHFEMIDALAADELERGTKNLILVVGRKGFPNSAMYEAIRHASVKTIDTQVIWT